MAVQEQRDTDAEREAEKGGEHEPADRIGRGRQAAAARSLADRGGGFERGERSDGRPTRFELEDPLLQVGELPQHGLVLRVDRADVRRVDQERGEKLLVQDLLLRAQRLALRIERVVHAGVGAVAPGRRAPVSSFTASRFATSTTRLAVLSIAVIRIAPAVFSGVMVTLVLPMSTWRAPVCRVHRGVRDRDRPVSEQLAHGRGNVAGGGEEYEPVEAVARRSVGDEGRGGAERDVVPALTHDGATARSRQPTDRERERGSDDDDPPVAPTRPKDLADSHAPTLRLL